MYSASSRYCVRIGKAFARTCFQVYIRWDKQSLQSCAGLVCAKWVSLFVPKAAFVLADKMAFFIMCPEHVIQICTWNACTLTQGYDHLWFNHNPIKITFFGTPAILIQKKGEGHSTSNVNLPVLRILLGPKYENSIDSFRLLLEQSEEGLHCLSFWWTARY